MARASRIMQSRHSTIYIFSESATHEVHEKSLILSRALVGPDMTRSLLLLPSAGYERLQRSSSSNVSNEPGEK